METAMQIGVITNPHSRKNRLRPGRAARLKSIVGSLGEVYETDSVDSIKPVLRDFLRKRARYWVADGGDGALHWMLRMGMEVLAEDEFADTSVTLPLLPTKGGTIDFVATNVGIRGTPESILANLRASIEAGQIIEEVEVDSMAIDGVCVDEDGRDEPFRTYGFASAAGGVGQRFFTKYYDADDPSPRTILKVLGNTVVSMPVALSPLRAVPGMPAGLRQYARDVFTPTRARIAIDGAPVPGTEFTGVHVASMSINLGNVFRFFGKADTRGRLNALVGSPSPTTILRNVPRMAMGRAMRGRRVIDRACGELTMEAIDELLSPIIDGEFYCDLRRVTFKLGPRVRIPKVVGSRAAGR
jgi:hypothetical protein